MEHPDYSGFPSHDIARAGVQKLTEYNWPKYIYPDNIDDHIKKIEAILGEYFSIILNLLYIHMLDSPLPFKFFRVRTLDSFNDPDLICEYSYKPVNLTTEIQRCNFPHKPVFYCSNDAGTALIEVLKDQNIFKDRKFLISRWSIISEKKTKIIPYLSQDLPIQNFYKSFGDKSLESISSIFENKLNASQVEGLKMYLNFLASVFLDDNYSLSASLAHRTLYATHNFRADIFVYPSVKTELKSINMAIHPNFVDNNMILERIYEVGINYISLKEGRFNIEIYRYADLEGSVIIWKNISPDDKIYQEGIRKDFNVEGDLIFNKNMETV
jgi:hypothetical protein